MKKYVIIIIIIAFFLFMYIIGESSKEGYVNEVNIECEQAKDIIHEGKPSFHDVFFFDSYEAMEYGMMSSSLSLNPPNIKIYNKGHNICIDGELFYMDKFTHAQEGNIHTYTKKHDDLIIAYGFNGGTMLVQVYTKINSSSWRLDGYTFTQGDFMYKLRTMFINK